MPGDAGRLEGKEVCEYRDFAWPLMQNTRNKATEARQLLNGELGITLPETVALAGAQDWVGDLPHKLTGPQRIRQKLIARDWEMKRPVTSGGPRAASVATRIEQPIQAIMRGEQAGFPDADVKDLLLIEGLAFGAVSVDLSARNDMPMPYKDGVRSFEAENLTDIYAVDAEGRFRSDEGYDAASVDIQKALKEAEADKTDFLARHLPFKQRAYSIRSCAPIWDGDLNLEGLIVETHWTASRLRRAGIHVGNRRDMSDAHLYPLGAIGEGDSSSGASGKPVKVVEAWLIDDDGLPYKSCWVDGYDYAWREKAKGRREGLESYLTDLSRICKDKRGQWQGFSRLPISWGWGLGWSTPDIDQRALPFTKPFQQSWKQVDMLMTCVVASMMWLAFPALIEKVSIADMADDTVDEKDRDNTPDIAPLKITKVTGDIVNIGSQGPHPSVFEAIKIALGENKAEQPGGEAGGAPSGFAQTISEALEQDAMVTIPKSHNAMASAHGSFILEAAKFVGECYEPVRVYQIADVLIEQNNPSATDQLLTIEPGLVGKSYDVRAIDKKTPGENPAVRQQNAALVKERFYDKVWFLEQDGYPSPEEMAMRVAWEDLLESEPGKASQLKMLEAFVSNKYVEQIQELISQGQANPQGLPTGFAGGTSQPPPDMMASGPQATGGMDGLTVGNPAASSLAGQVGAGLQTGPTQNAVNAGGVMPAAPLMSGVS